MGLALRSQTRQQLGRHHHPVADTAELDHHVVRAEVRDRAAQRADHRAPASRCALVPA